MLATQQRKLDDLTEFQSFVQVVFESVDQEHHQILRITIAGDYEGLYRCRRHRRWFLLLRDENGMLRMIRTLEIVAIYHISRT